MLTTLVARVMALVMPRLDELVMGAWWRLVKKTTLASESRETVLTASAARSAVVA